MKIKVVFQNIVNQPATEDVVNRVNTNLQLSLSPKFLVNTLPQLRRVDDYGSHFYYR